MNTTDIIAHAKSRFDHVSARRVLKEKYEAKMLFAYNGGMWRAGPELLTLLHAVPVEDDVVLLDLYSAPIKKDQSLVLAQILLTRSFQNYFQSVC